MTSSWKMENWLALMAGGLMLLAMTGCQGTTSVLPNPDPALRQPPARFAADAAKRSYPASAPKAGEATARVRIDYFRDTLGLVNLSDHDWTNIEVWVNEKYVCFVPNAPKGQMKTLDFQMLYDTNGHYLPTNALNVEKVEVLVDGKMYSVSSQLAD